MTYTQHPDGRQSRASCDHQEGDNVLSNLNLNEMSKLHIRSHSLSGICFSPPPWLVLQWQLNQYSDSDAVSLNPKAVN